MALSIDDLKMVRATQPPRTLIYGPPGQGKTTLASEWPNPVFLQVEDGTPGALELASFGKLSSFDDVMDAISALYSGEHKAQSVVLDSLDKLEPMVWAKTCSENSWESIETPGYGKGYIAADVYWREIIDGMNALRRDKNMSSVYIAHSTIETVNDPMSTSYSRYDIRLQKRAVAIFQDEVDCILFLNQDVTLKQDDPHAKKGKGTRVRADGGGTRWIYAAPRPSFVAKNRYDLADKMIYTRGEGYAALAESFPTPMKKEEK